MRRDAFGAKSVLFDWVLGPLVRRWGGDEGENAGEGFTIYRATTREQRGTRTTRPAQEEEQEEEEEEEDYSPRPSNEQDLETRDSYSLNNDDLSFPQSPVSSHTSLHSLSPRPSPKIWTTQTPPRPTRRKPPHSSIDLAQDVPYRSVSSAHPLLYSTASTKSKGRDSLLLESPPRLERRLDQTTTDSEEEREDKGAGSPPRTEAEEGIKRWATLLSVKGELETKEVVGLENVGRGWSV